MSSTDIGLDVLIIKTRDNADIAKEIMNMTKASILMQAAMYAMSLHRQQAFSILQLLNPGR